MRSASSSFGFWAISLFANLAHAQETTLVSHNFNGNPGNGSCAAPALSSDGRYVAFETNAPGLAPGNSASFRDVLVRDRETGTIEVASKSSSGAPGNQHSEHCDISGDGRFVVFSSYATTLVTAAGLSTAMPNVYLRDRATQQTVLVSRTPSGDAGAGSSFDPTISKDGRYVAFTSNAGDLVVGDSPNSYDAFVFDRLTGTITRENTTPGGIASDGISWATSISADGRFIAFRSNATNLVGTLPQHGPSEAYVRDRWLGVTKLVSHAAGGDIANAHVFRVTLSDDGSMCSFESTASNLVPGDTNSLQDSFVWWRSTDTVTRESLGAAGNQLLAETSATSLSGDGRYLTFSNSDPSVVTGDTNGVSDVFVRDLHVRSNSRISQSAAGIEGNATSYEGALNADGSVAVFITKANNFGSPGNIYPQVYVSGYAPPCQANLGFAHGGSLLIVCGSNLATGTLGKLALIRAPENSPTFLFASTSATPTFSSTLNATFLPIPVGVVVSAMTDGLGRLESTFSGGAGPFSVYVQAITSGPPIVDYPYDVSNAVRVDLMP